MIDLTFVHLHSPLFFAKRNWGEKLTPNSSKGKLQMRYDREQKEVLLKCDGHQTIIPTSNVVSMDPAPAGIEDFAEAMTAPAVNPMVNPPKGKPGPKPKAQVSGPHDHVFAQAPGKVRD